MKSIVVEENESIVEDVILEFAGEQQTTLGIPAYKYRCRLCKGAGASRSRFGDGSIKHLMEKHAFKKADAIAEVDRAAQRAGK